MRRALIVGLLILSCASARAATLNHDAYVWQRAWTRPVAAAIAGSADLVHAWRVLAAEAGPDGTLHPIAIDHAALTDSGRPVVLVVRIDGQIADWNRPDLPDAVVRLVEGWPAPASIEIDHDCGTAHLAEYAAFLGRLKQRLGGLPLSITALPAWLDAPSLAGVLAATDEAVLQVHAVKNPRGGLFDPTEARRWIDAYARRTTKPFRVALPTYGSRVTWSTDGKIFAVDSEAPRLAGGGEELVADPAAVAGLLRTLDEEPPPHLAGIAWFRLPTDADRRAWSLATWRLVVTGRPLDGAIAATAPDGGMPGLRDLVLTNGGTADTLLPARLDLPADCAIADGINGYRLGRDPAGLRLERTEPGLLHGHRVLQIGWMRCAPGEIHVIP
jgi:hypothetical protein